jgi:RNA polymerase sigma factor (sigma-70 family)
MQTGRAGVNWETALRSYHARVVTSLLAMSISLDQAEELASQTWTRLMEQERSGQLTDIKLPGLAIKQARFLALNWVKARRREAGLAEDLPGHDDPERAVIERDDVAVALRVLASCSPSAQEVFRLLYDHPPPSHDEVARRVGLSTQRVRQILCEVRKRIRQALEQSP